MSTSIKSFIGWNSTFHQIASVSLPFLLGACTFEEPREFDEVESSEDPLLNATGVSGTQFSVKISTSSGSCSGVVINERAILTAGHCYPDGADTPTTVAPTTISATVGKYGASQIVFSGHGQWKLRTGHDLAIVLLPVPLGNVRTATIWDGAMATGSPFWIWGWGDPDGKSTFSYLTSLDSVTSSVVGYVGEQNWARHCRGDSGGAWETTDHHVFGIHSNSERNGNCLDVGGWARATRLSVSTDWIQSSFVFGCDEYGDVNAAHGAKSHYLDCSDGTVRNIGTMKQQSSGKCMDAQWNADTSRTPLWLWACSSGNAQQFAYDASSNALRFRNDMCVDVQWGNFSDGTPVWLWPCTGGAAQQWEKLSGFQSLKSAYRVVGTNLCLTTSSSADQTPLTIRTCSGATNQQWTLN